MAEFRKPLVNSKSRMDDFLRPILDSFTLRRQREWSYLQKHGTTIQGVVYIVANRPLEEVMRGAIRDVIQGRKFRIAVGGKRITGKCAASVDDIAIDESGGRLDLRLVFHNSDSPKELLWLRWELTGDNRFLQARYTVRGAKTEPDGSPTAVTMSLARGIIDLLDSYLYELGFGTDIQLTYPQKGWAGAAQSLDLTIEGSAFLTGARHGNAFVSEIAKVLRKTPTEPRTTYDEVTWLVQLSNNRSSEGSLSGVLLCQPSVYAPRSVKTLHTVVSCVVSFKPILSLPNYRPGLKLSFGLIGELKSIDRVVLTSVALDFVKLIERSMIASGAVVCGEQKNAVAMIEHAWEVFDSIHQRRPNKLPSASGPPLTTPGASSMQPFTAPSIAPVSAQNSARNSTPGGTLNLTPTEDHTAWLFEEPRTVEIRRWPSAQDFCEAIQSPRSCFDDPNLQELELELDSLGLPKVASGAFACVFRMAGKDSDWAIRCFTTRIKDQFLRYERISRRLKKLGDDLPYTVDFEYLHNGINLDGAWYPILKMQWVAGTSINDYVERHLKDAARLEQLRKDFSTMLRQLHERGIAHGDLQHGNIMVRNDALVLLDYDGMFVPELTGFWSPEKGHPNYQHPSRGSHHFNKNLDNFSGWLVDSALLALGKAPELWCKFGAGDESLLFRRTDLAVPHDSPLIQMLRDHQDQELAERGRDLCVLLSMEQEDIPPVFLTSEERASNRWKTEVDQVPAVSATASISPAEEVVHVTADLSANNTSPVQPESEGEAPWWLDQHD